VSDSIPGLPDLAPDLLAQALTHRSAAFEQGGLPHNERLELLGDAVLDLAVTALLFEADPTAPEGVLSRRRAQLVREGTLAAAARDIGLGPHLRLGRGEAASGGRDKDSLLADALEALIGAVHLTHGYRVAADWVSALLAVPVAAQQADRSGSAADDGIDAKTALQERTAALGLGLPAYHFEQQGPAHDPAFIAEVTVAGEVLGTGRGRSKKESAQTAAAQALAALPLG
jgi:ribonuclease III